MLKAVLTAEEWGGLSADVKTHYALVDEDGSYRLEVSPAGGFEFANTQGLKSALQKERTARGSAESKLNALTEKVGDMDVDAGRAAIEKVAEMADFDPDKKLAAAKEEFEKKVSEKYDALSKATAMKHTTEVDGMKATMATTLAQLQKELIASAATAAISKAGGSVELLLPIVERTTRMQPRDDGTFVAEVVDIGGQPRLSPKAGKMDPMSVAELVEEMRGNDTYARAFDGTGASGSGSSRNAAGGGKPAGGAKTVAKGDLAGMAANMEGIAKGEVTVVDA